MRKLLPFLLLTACSSGAVPTTPPPPPGAPTAASLSIVAGDGQAAAPATALPVRPAVLVATASGDPVPGIAVTFTVDSGGGSLSATAAVSGANGVATAGIWTLGQSGNNVVTAHIGTTLSVKLHAQAFAGDARTLINAAPVSSAGGTLTYTKAGDPLSGLTVTIPAGAYAGATQWTITADSSTVPTLPADFIQVGPTLVISTGQGYADSIVSLTMPLATDPSMVVAPFYFDPVSKALEPIPLLARTVTGATLGARHFSADLMAIPGTAPTSGSLRAAALRSFGAVRIVWVAIPPAKLSGTFDSGFRIGTDNWEFANYGDYISPEGDCEGMSITELYYYYFVTLGGRPPLYHHFDTSIPNQWDNVQGIRFAASVQGDFDTSLVATIGQETRLTQTAGSLPALLNLTSSWIALTLKLTGQPVLLALHNATSGHAVVAYSITTTGNTSVVAFADPNFPTTLRTLSFVNGVATPVQQSPNVTAAPQTYNQVLALAVTAEVPLRNIDTRWKEFLNKGAAADRYPAGYFMRTRDSLNHSWNNLVFGGPADTIRTSVQQLQSQFLCPDCPIGVLGASPPELALLRVWDDSGATGPQDNPFGVISLAPGFQSPVMVAYAPSPSFDRKTPIDFGFVDARPVTVVYRPFLIWPPTDRVTSGTPVTYSATDGGLATPTSRYTWDFGDATPLQIVVHDSTTIHTFANNGTHRVIVTLVNGDAQGGGTVGIDTLFILVSNNVIWRFTSASAPVVTLPAGGIGATAQDTIARDTVVATFAALASRPGDNRIFLLDSLGCHQIYWEQFPPGHANDSTIAPDAAVLLFGTEPTGICAVPGYNTTVTVGSIGAGPLNATLTPKNPLLDGIETGASLTSVMTGTTLTGSFVLQVYYTSGIGTYRVDFVATQVVALPKPPPAGLRARRGRDGP
jgi:hypothetical protein